MDACRRMIHRRAAQQDPFVRPAGTNAGTFPAKLLRMRDTPRQLGFVGREPEMARLNGYLDQALAKGGGVCFVTGEPGAGKSSLLGEFTRRLQGTHPDIVFAVGDCNPQTGTVDPYLPFREIMGHLTGSAEAAADEAPARRGSPRFFAATARILQEHGPDLIDIFVPGAAVLTRLGAQAAGKMRARRGTGDGHGVPEAGRLEQHHLFEQYTSVLRETARQRPLVLLVDDLHWADEGSIGLLFHLARRLSSEPVLLVGAYRANEIAAGRGADRHPLEAPLNELQRYFGDIVVDLEQAREREGRDFIDQLLDAEPNTLDAAFRDALYQRTGGQALYTVELVHFLREQGLLAQTDRGDWAVAGPVDWDRLPARVEGVISERTARLAADERELLTAASVLGESFAAEVLARALERDLRAVIRQLSGSLARTHQLVRALGFERLGGQRLSQYEFRHNLIHNYFYQSLDPIERGFMHEAAGLAMEALFGSEPGPLAVHLARHFAEAGITERAIEFRVLAGQEARRAFANAEAIAHFEQALELLQATDGTETAPTSPQPGQAGILTALGEVLLLDGAFEPARGKLERALRLTADDDGIARARLLRKVATTHEREHEHGQAMERLEQAAALLGEARDSGDTAVLHEWIAIQVSRLWLLYWQGDTDGMQAIVQDAEAIVERHANDTQKYRYYGAKTGLGNRLDRFAPSERTLEASQQALRAAQASTQILDHADGLFGTGFIHLLRNQLAEALELFTRSLELARRCGDRTLQARCLTYLVVLQRRAGQEHAVEALLPEARALCDSLRMAEYLAVLAACESWLAWRHDDFGAARQLAEQALALWEERAPRYPFKWLALLQSMAMDYREGRTDTALEAARALLTPPMARLAGGLEEALRAAVSDRDGQPDPADPARLGAAVECARAAGYL